MKDEFVGIFHRNEFRKWLAKNHDKKKKVGLILHKKHTGKNSPSHRELMEEAICFGWIDTTVRRLDSDRYVRFFSKRNKNSMWSYNTLGYAKDLVKKKMMTPHGMKFYREGLKKLPHDHGLPKNPSIPIGLKKALAKSKTARKSFDSLPNSMKRTYLRWIFRAKMQDTKNKRIDFVVKNMSKGKWTKRTSWEINK